ncbi:alpha/beta hydrolase [Altererythrobacter sp. KTW20L]|uniref:alpha/beta fold hydrolase n=1 Tax=Altererythrobacter sp. KTW20L TaxID=2942210 RepID=UPI0020BEA06C|nr:alpha/beta fold hydrolase [Altererythrobacter sp. KTW20L]MCL6251833.1 alpha/beta hydrolase [Altererythrobacter sp. KTW20L]
MIDSFDGTPLAIHRIGPKDGGGRPVLLLHGLFSSADMNWIRFGHAKAMADAGFEAIMLDHRAHGDSGAPQDPAAYPAGVLARDVEHVVGALGLDDFDLVGFSMGGRTAAAAVIAGLVPRRLVLAGMGLESLDNWARRAAFFIDAIDRFEEVKQGDPAFFTVQFMKTMKIDRVAARLLLESDMEIDPTGLSRITMSTLVLCGEDDRDNGSPHALAEALPDARLKLIPGTHMSSVTKPDMGQAIEEFLSED